MNSLLCRAACGWLAALLVAQAAACPFCTALRPSLAQRREAASAVALAECTAAPQDGAAGRAAFRVHQWFKGGGRPGATLELPADQANGCRKGGLALVFGEPSGGEARWTATPVTEIAARYFALAPEARLPATERLRYFLKHLEHADPVIAEDAYLEFGLASFADVEKLAGEFDSAALRAFATDPGIRSERRGFYGLALGIAAKAQPAEREANLAVLRSKLDEPSPDFRAGFDGVLGGYLAAVGPEALAEIERRYFADPQSREGDVRHALAAVRFAREFLSTIPPERVSASIRPLLSRPEFASEAIVDLARWQDWSVLQTVAGLYGRPEYDQPATDRAVVGYLTACPTPAADELLESLRQRDPSGVAACERVLRQLGRVAD